MSELIDETADTNIGRLIAKRYELLHAVGDGGMGVVYRALDKRLGRDVAVKLLLPRWSQDKATRTRFIREARVAAQLKHPNAIEVFDFGEHESSLYLVMELLRGETLFDYMTEQGQLPIQRVAHVGYRIADVLVAAHELTLVHRDLKPENVFLEGAADKERIVVMDFGLAFIADAKAAIDRRLTKEGLIGGTPYYMSPEQARGRGVGLPADVYSFGCMLYEMLTTTVPFEGSAPEVVADHMYKAPEDVRTMRPDCPVALAELIMRMLEKHADKRPTAEGVRKRLAALDSANLNSRERARDATYLSTREQRMVSEVRPNPGERTRFQSDQAYIAKVAEGLSEKAVVGVVGAMPPGLSAGLVANGISTISFSTEANEDVTAVFVADPAAADMASITALGVPVVAACDTANMENVTALLRAGVAEVVPTPIEPAGVARKLWRAITKAKARNQ